MKPVPIEMKDLCANVYALAVIFPPDASLAVELEAFTMCNITVKFPGELRATLGDLRETRAGQFHEQSALMMKWKMLKSIKTSMM